ncbi:F-box only protein 7-like [Diadema setosum]|uniref:F-box only protein 7-like n=1 Tax=Diadema setosum TaxID=31175 RepID=UPI003B3B5560
MKLRVRLGKRTEKVDLQDGSVAGQTLGDLSACVCRLFGLELGQFALSLNGRDPIKGDPEELLTSFDIVSGDLVKVLVPESYVAPGHLQQNGCSSSSSSSRPGSTAAASSRPDTTINGSIRAPWEDERQAEERQVPGPNDHHVSDSPGGSNSAENAQEAEGEVEMDEEERALRERLAQLDEAAQEGEKISEPMLCRDAEDGKIPLRLKQLCAMAQPENKSDALCIALHVLMLETGFFVSEAAADDKSGLSSTDQSSQEEEHCAVSSSLPADWKKGSSYTLRYQHLECRDLSCVLVCIVMGTKLVVQGVLKKDILGRIQLTPQAFVSSISDGDATYTGLPHLSRIFKDAVTYRLLAGMRTELGLPALNGLMAMLPEMQLKILSYLNVASLITMTTVCKHFHTLANDMTLWRQLVLRDFGGKAMDRQSNWKNAYREKYRLKKLREQLRSRIQSSFYPPGRRPFAFVPYYPSPVPGVYPPGFRGGDYDLDPFNSRAALPGFPAPGSLPMPGPLVPGPRHDPIFPNPDSDLRPGHGGGMRDMDTGRPHPYAPQPSQDLLGMPGRRMGGRNLGGMRGFFR